MADEEVKVVGTTSVSTDKKPNWKIIGAIVGVVVLALGVIAGIILVRQSQDIREKAACVEQCPGSDGVLRSCTPPEADGSSSDSLCNFAGRIELCGGTQFCCPSAGGAWTTNLSLCPQTTPTLTPTPTPTPTPTESGIPTGTASPTPTPTATTTAGTGGTVATATPTVTASSTATSTASAQAGSTSTPTTSAFPVPDTGASLPTLLGLTFGALLIIGSLVLVF